MNAGGPQLGAAEAEARQRFVDVMPQLEEWVRRTGRAPVVMAGSELDEDVVLGGWRPWQLAHFSLATGSHHLYTAAKYLLEVDLSTVAVHSLFRTALWGGAQGLWLVHPESSAERAKNAQQVLGYSMDNHRKWLNTFADEDPVRPGSEPLAAAKARIGGYVDQLGSKGPQQHAVIAWAAKVVFDDQVDAALDVERAWRELGAVAHAVPWELSRRPSEVVDHSYAGTTRAVRGAWTELQGVFSYGVAVLAQGWETFEKRASTAARTPGKFRN